MNEVYQLLEKNAVVQIALRPGGVERFCDADATEGQEKDLEDLARRNGWRDGLVVGNGKSSTGGMPTESVWYFLGECGDQHRFCEIV